MKDYGLVRSTVRPEEKKIDEYSVWICTDITETEEGFEYNMVQYSKNEYINKLQSDIEYLAMMSEVELE